MAASASASAASNNKAVVAIGLVLVLLSSAYVQQAQALTLPIPIINLSLAPVTVSASVNATVLGSVRVGALLNVTLPLLTATIPVTVNLTITNGLTGASITIPNVSLGVSTVLVITPSIGLPQLPPLGPIPIPLPPLGPILTAVSVFLTTVVNGVSTLVATLVTSL